MLFEEVQYQIEDLVSFYQSFDITTITNVYNLKFVLILAFIPFNSSRIVCEQALPVKV